MSDAQYAWAEVLFDGLARAGVRQVVLSPGSRSTPLAWAAQVHPELEVRCVVDERSAGFFAYGQARLSGLPSALVCTSGTALCHYLPALVEARQSRVPMLVVSADRPFELSDCGAPQSIDQSHVLGPLVRFVELGNPVEDVDALLGLRRAALRAVHEARTSGPVHLNFRARKPLEPTPCAAAPALPAAPSAPLADAASPPLAAEVKRWLLDRLMASERPLLACGTLGPRESPPPALVAELARLSGCALHVEASSQLRFRLPSSTPGACDAAEWLWGSRFARPRFEPDFVLQLGAPPLSASLQNVLAAGGPALAVASEAGWPDPFHKSASIVRASPTEVLQALCDGLSSRESRASWCGPGSWVSRANRLARGVVAEHLSGAGFGEAAVVTGLLEAMPRGSLLCVGNSLPPRHLDRYCGVEDRALTVLSQRGASGIDGCIAAAIGSASVADGPATALLGDVSFLHDLGSLWAASAARLRGAARRHPLVLVVINNDGGRIFEQLPVADRTEVDLGLWTTPHGLRFEHAARLYGIDYAAVDAAGRLSHALAAAYARPRVTLVEAVVSPGDAKRCAEDIARALESEWARLDREPA